MRPVFSNLPTTNNNYGGFYESPRISLQLMPKRIKNEQLEIKKTALATSNSEYGGFFNFQRSPRSTRPFVARSLPSPVPQFQSRVEEPPGEGILRYNDRRIHLPDVDTVELHMKDKSRILLSVKEFYRRHLDI